MGHHYGPPHQEMGHYIFEFESSQHNRELEVESKKTTFLNGEATDRILIPVLALVTNASLFLIKTQL